jgi:lysophospholipase L1-like esterase
MNSDMKNFMKKRHYDFCFISAGINDTYKKMSIDYYKTSMNYIIQFMLANNIRPIILEIPDYDIMKAYNLQRIERKLLRRLSMFITGTQMDCKQDFRNALRNLIREKKYHHLVDVIDYKEWNNNMEDDLRQFYNSDGLHLNQKGYMKLDSVIAKHIANN